MTLALVFWPLLTLPGYAIARRWFARDLECGLLGVIGLSFLLSLAALSPVSIACYLLHLPVAVFSAACVLAVLIAAIDLTRAAAWGALGRLIAGGICIELVILAADVALGVRAGGYLTGDAIVHVGRVRFMLDNGFSNLDPNFLEPYFFAIYHTNIMHALFAACTQLTPSDHLGVWFITHAWAKVLAASGIYTLAWTIFRRQWPAWAAVLCFVAVTGTVPFMLYPNKLAPWYLLPMLFAFGVRAACGDDPRRSVALLAIGAFLVGQVHGLYGLFAVMTLGPMLAGSAILARIRGGVWRPAAAAAVAVCCALPFPVITTMGRTPWQAQTVGTAAVPVEATTAAPPPAATESPPTAGDPILRLDNGWSMRDPRGGFTARGGWRPILLLGAAVALLFTDRRRYATATMALLGLVGVYLYVPPVFTLLLDVVEREWILLRMEELLKIGFVAMVPATVVYFIARRTTNGWVRVAVALAIFSASMRYQRHAVESLRWSNYVSRALGSAADRMAFIDKLRTLGGFAGEHIPAGSVILADEYVTQRLISVHDCYGVSSALGSIGVPDLGRRRLDREAMLDDGTPWEDRRALLEKYRITHFVPSRMGATWLDGHVRGAWHEPDVAIIVELTLENDGFRLGDRPDGDRGP